ncbi:MAG TPA: heme o synthase [Acidobacteriaceae bacterium]|nr:heme o synthase [Acidobacteriaceae bacterium]
MSATSTAVRARSHSLAVLSDYFLLTKPRVSAMVVLTAAGGYYLGCLRSGISPFSWSLIEALFGIALVTAGSSALNQAFERVTDRLMPRTSQRPMAQHRIGLPSGLVTGFLLTFLGSLYLAWTTNLLTGTLTLLTAVLYVGIYTPLKRITRLNTFIGAFPGALPPLIGWTAARGIVEWPAIALFAILFVWQFPHFMSIGWLYRKDYMNAGIRVTSTHESIEKAARRSAIEALVYAVLMIPISVWPTFVHVTGIPYAIAAAALGLWYLYATIRFARITRNPEDPQNRVLARNLLKVSVMYLPLLLLAMALNAQGRLLF